jgi:hypothetical protein
MTPPNQLDLPAYMKEHFPGFHFGGGVIDQSTFGLRFDIGFEHVDRAVSVYHEAFANADELVLVSDESTWDSDPARWCSLFVLPGAIQASLTPVPASYSYRLSEDPSDEYKLSWAQVRRSAVNAEPIFRAIANQDHGLTPSVLGRVFILDSQADLLLHMYDDRGLDIIATSEAPLLLLYERFEGWVLRRRIYSTDEAER